MSERTAIQWTDSTWNPWHGCAKVSPGCEHCYMFREKRQYGQDPEKVMRSKTMFDAPLGWKDHRRVFTCSWSDFFIKDADAWRPEAWDIIRRTPHLTYQILTKRPARIARHLPDDWGEGYPNVWLGVSVESQEFTRRIPVLLRVPAAVYFISAEPLLGSLNLRPYLSLNGKAFHPGGFTDSLSWVIVGGESGKDFRPMNPAWVRDLREQCTTAGTPFFFKQWDGYRPKLRGRELDGREWNEFPGDAGQAHAETCPGGKAVTSTPLCRDAQDPSAFCRWATKCSDVRQRIQHGFGLRGRECWAYSLRVEQAAYPDVSPDALERQAIQEEDESR